MSTSRDRGPARKARPRADSATDAAPSRPAAEPRPAAASPTKRPAAVDDAGLAEVRFLTVAEVASVMRVSKMTVYRLVHGGDLPAVRVGRSFRVPDQAVHDYLQAAYIEAG
jgi:excisionase family DNA binding protein